MPREEGGAGAVLLILYAEDQIDILKLQKKRKINAWIL
jgi:hypothetical protein